MYPSPDHTTPHAKLEKTECLFSVDAIHRTKDTMILFTLNYLYSNGISHLTKNLSDHQKTQCLKSEDLNQEHIIQWSTTKTRSSFSEVMEVLTIKELPSTIFINWILTHSNGENQSQKEILQNLEEDMLQLSLLTSLRWWCSVDGILPFSSTTFFFMILRLKAGKIHKLHMKSQSGMSMDVWPLQFHPGNTSFLEEAVEVSLKEATELEANTITIPGFWMSITLTGFQLRWNKRKTNFPWPDSPPLLFTMLMIRDYTYSEVGLMNGSMTCGCFQLVTSLVHLMLSTILSPKWAHWLVRQNYLSTELDSSNLMGKLLLDFLEARHLSMLRVFLKMKILLNARLLTLNNLAQRNAKLEYHAANTIWQSQKQISLISWIQRLIKQSVMVQDYSTIM